MQYDRGLVGAVGYEKGKIRFYDGYHTREYMIFFQDILRKYVCIQKKLSYFLKKSYFPNAQEIEFEDGELVVHYNDTAAIRIKFSCWGTGEYKHIINGEPIGRLMDDLRCL